MNAARRKGGRERKKDRENIAGHAPTPELANTVRELGRHAPLVHQEWWRKEMAQAVHNADPDTVFRHWVQAVLAGTKVQQILARAEDEELGQCLKHAAGDEWVREAREAIGIRDRGLREQARVLLHKRSGIQHMRNQDPGAGIAFAATTEPERREESGAYLAIAIREYCEDEQDRLGRKTGQDRKRIAVGAMEYLAMVLLRIAGHEDERRGMKRTKQ